jgi:transcriptional regulator with XRE-family HTH domain
LCDANQHQLDGEQAGRDNAPKQEVIVAIILELRTAIQASGKSYNQLETEIGLGRGIISRFVKGQRDIGLETAEKIAEYFGLQLRLTEEELDRIAERIAAMKEEAETAQTRLLKVQESMAVLLRMTHEDHLRPKSLIEKKPQL